MLNNITTDIKALQLKDINIGIGGAALGESITNLSTALNEQIASSLILGDMLYVKIGLGAALEETERIRSVAVDAHHAAEIALLRDENNQY